VGPQPKTPGDLIDQTRQAAIAAGIDPDIFARQIQQESGFNPNAQSPAGALGIAQFMPATAKQYGVDPMDPASALAGGAKYDAELLKQYGGDWSKALAAYNGGDKAVQQLEAGHPWQETQGYLNSILGGAKDVIQQGAGAVQGAAQNVVQTGQTAVNTATQAAQSVVARTSQFAMGLSSGDAMAFCGPAAAMAFADTYGRNPTVDEAKQLAQQVGWNPNQGMAGAQSEVKLLNAMGVDAHMTQGVDWSAVGQDAQGGNPVIIDTPGHYYYVDGYNADTGKLHVGTSGTDLKGGSEWMSPDQINAMPQSDGNARAAIFADHPLSGPGQAATTARTQTPSALTMGGNQPDVTSQLLNAGGSALNALSAPGPFGTGFALQQGQNLASQLLSSPDVQNKAQDVAQAVLNVGGAPAQGFGQTGLDLLNQAQTAANPLTSAVSQAPQSVSDILNQNALVSQGIPTVTSALQALPDLSAQGIVGAGANVGTQLPSYLQSLAQTPQDLLTQAGTSAQDLLGQAGQARQAWSDLSDQQQALANSYGLTDITGKPLFQGQPLDLTKPLGPQLGIDPYGQIVQQGIPNIVQSAQQGNVGGVLGGGLQTLLGAASALPGGGGAEAGGSALEQALSNPATGDALRNLLTARLPTTGLGAAAPEGLEAAQTLPVSAVPWSEQSLAALRQELPGQVAGPTSPLLTGAFDELGRRIPPGMIENPLTSAELGMPSYDQYGVFQRAPAMYSERGIAIDPATGQEIVPPSQGPLDWRTQLPASTTIEGLQQMAQARGLNPDAQILMQRLQGLTDQVNAAGITGGAQPGMATAQFARLLGGGAAGGLGTYAATDPNDPNRWLKVAGGAGLGALAGGPGLDVASQIPGRFAAASGSAPGAIGLGDWARGLYRGGVISGLNTMADVASNATIGPLMSAGAGYLRDLASLSPGAAAGRTLGALSGMATWGDNFLDGLSQSLSRPGSLTSRAGPGMPQIVANLADGFGAMHGAFQNATSMLQQSMEMGAAAGDRAGSNIFDPAWHSAYASNLTSLPADVIARAQGAGARAAASSDLGQLTGALGKLVGNMGPVGDALFPVYRMGMSLGSRMVEFSPLGLAGTALDVGKSLVGRGPYAAGLGTTPVSNAVGPIGERLANNVLGTALSVWLANKALGGAITGSGPTDAGQRAVWLASGNQPDSFLAPDGTYHSWDKLPPQLRGPMMAAGAYADSVQAYNQALAKQQTAGSQAYGVEDPRFAQAAQLVSEVGKQLMSATPLRTFANLYDSLSSGSIGSTGLAAAGDIPASIAGGAIPASGLVRSVAQMTDPFQRQTLNPRTPQQLPQSIQENVMQNIPGLAETLPARQDILGRAIPNPLQGLGEISPFRAATGQPTPVLAAMQNAGVAPSAPPNTIPYGPAEQIALTPAEQRAWQQLQGQILQQSAARMVTSPSFQAATPRSQALSLKMIDQTAAHSADMQLLGVIGREGPGTLQARREPTPGGMLAPAVGYGPDVTMNQQLLQQQLQRTAQSQALINSLLATG
jgi:hypothetical protein